MIRSAKRKGAAASRRAASAAWSVALALICGCDAAPKPRFAPGPQASLEARSTVAPTTPPPRVEPFSPTLGALFVRGKLVAIPSDTPPTALGVSPTIDFRFAAIDGWGRVYLFYQDGRWELAPTRPLPERLPTEAWRVAYNAYSATIELLVLAPYGDAVETSLFMLRGDEWRLEPTEGAPTARIDALAVHLRETGQWCVVSGPDVHWRGLYRLDGTRWRELPAGGGPDLKTAAHAIALHAPGGFGLLTRSGELWRFDRDRWERLPDLGAGDPILFHYDPIADQLRHAARVEGGAPVMKSLSGVRSARPTEREVTVIETVERARVGEGFEGALVGLARLTERPYADGAIDAALTDDLNTSGPLVVRLQTDDEEELDLLAERIESIELGPSLESIAPRRGAWIPLAGGVIEVSREPTGAAAFRPASGPLAPLAEAVDLTRRNARFWLYELGGIEHLGAFAEFHPDLIERRHHRSPRIGAVGSYAWRRLDDGSLSFDYRRESADNVQWNSSPPLTLRGLPEAQWREGDRFELLEPIALGDPAEIVVAGWSGRPVQPSPPVEGKAKSFDAIPERGFFARVSALDPQSWTSGVLPIPYGEGVRPIDDPSGEAFWLMGGRLARKTEGDYRARIEPNEEVWRFADGAWVSMETVGPKPKLDGDFDVGVDYAGGGIWFLTRAGLYRFAAGVWEELWRDPQAKADRPAPFLSVHPVEGEVLGVWPGEPARVGLWRESGWTWIEAPEGVAPPVLRGAADVRPLFDAAGWAAFDSSDASKPGLRIEIVEAKRRP